jgi:lysylphosphatidylglycerol synthetase-like protein (DUF2156 family)
LASRTDIPDRLEVEVPVGGRVLVAADLHLARAPSAAVVANGNELAAAIEAATGPGVLLVAGNLFDTPAPNGPSERGAPAIEPAAALSDHPRLVGAISAYAAGPGRRVIVLPGDRDAFLAWSEPCRSLVEERLGATLALAVDLHLDTGAGRRQVRVESGCDFDALARFHDPRNPGESPFAQHIRNELLPSVRRRQTGGAGWLTGLEQLDDPAALSRFIASRLVYRRLMHTGWLLLIPVVFALVLRIPTLALRSARHGEFSTRVGWFAVAVALELLLLFGLGVVALRRTNQALAALALDEQGRDPNQAARAVARSLVTSGYAGLITAHTCRPELAHLGAGFYANVGAVSDVVTEYPSRMPGLGLPPVFLGHRLLSWVELEAGSDIHVRLLHGRQDLTCSTVLERLVARRPDTTPGDAHVGVVAAFPQGQAWPQAPSTEKHDRRIRRIAAAVVVLVGFLSLVSAMSDPLRDRLDVLRQLFPLYVPETAAALAAFAGVGLIVLARGIRRGQRSAWLVSQALLLTVGVLHLIKGVDVEEMLVVFAVAGFLWVERDSFAAKTDVIELRRGLGTVGVAALLTVAAGTLAVEVSTWIDHSRDRAQPRISWLHAFEAATERMVGFSSVALPHRINNFLAPAMLTATVGLVLALLFVIFRPVVARRVWDAGHRRGPPTGDAFTGPTGPASAQGMARARDIVARHGSGTLDYFALRPDKEFFFWGDTVVAFAVYGGVCLVSPDPIGPVAEREEAWRAFRRFVDGHGWALGGLGAGEDWLPIYRATGMHDLYVGDEGVVRIGSFTLEGGRFKGLRQAVNRVAKYGYTISFHDPSQLDESLRGQLKDVMTKSRRGDVERGFSMTLGRVFDPDDAGLLLAVVHAPEGSPVAFCQFVPAPGIGGYSLDLMRRDDGEHPNGIIDFAVVETIKELQARHCEGLGLNFATMRAVLAGEAGEGVTQRVQAWLLRRMGDSMQIESLWKFNAKFDPDWQPRYAIYDAPENMLGVAIAVARAESFWELPLIGRFLVPAAAKA